MKGYISKQITDSIDIKKKLINDDFIALIQKVAEECIKSLDNGGKILLAGNGGSAADAQHIAGELVSKFYFDRPALASQALTTDTSIMTAIGNDYGYERLFARQIEGNGVAGDVFIGITTSGNSPNIIEALNTCKEKGIVTVGLTGETGGKIADMCDYCIKIPSGETPRIQEAHIMVGHILCACIEEQIFGKGF